MKNASAIINNKPLRGTQKIWLVFVLGALTAFGPLSMDMYLPALPIVTADFSTTASLAQLSITSCLIGLAVGQLFFGPLSDVIGRKKPLLMTLTVYMAASLLCALSVNIWMFTGLRFVQGLAGSAGVVISRAAAKDLFDGKELTKFIALLALVNGAAPILAPISGGAILNWVSWEMIFYLLALIGLLMLLAIAVTFRETLPEEQRGEGGLLKTLQNFRVLFFDKEFMGISLTFAFVSMSMFAYISGSPFVLQNVYDLSAQQFSVVFATNGIGIILAAQLAGKLSDSINEKKLLQFGAITSFTGAILLFIAITFHAGLWIVLLSLFLIVSSVGIVNTTSFSLGMQKRGKIAGSASAFLGILPFGGGGLVSPLVGMGGDYSAFPMALTILICSLIAFILYTVMVKQRASI